MLKPKPKEKERERKKERKKSKNNNNFFLRLNTLNFLDIYIYMTT